MSFYQQKTCHSCSPQPVHITLRARHPDSEHQTTQLFLFLNLYSCKDIGQGLLADTFIQQHLLSKYY